MAASENYLTQAAADARYMAAGGLSDASPSQVDANDAASAGVSASASRADHQHAVPVGTPVSIGLTGVNNASATTSLARSQHVHAYNPPACRVYNSVNQSIPDNVSTVITFNSERYDTDSMHSTSSNTSRITFTTAGVYLLTFNAQLAAANDYVQALPIFRLNGTQDLAYGTRLPNLAASPPLLTMSTVYKFNAGDYIEVLVYQDNSANAARNLEINGPVSFECSATWIGVG